MCPQTACTASETHQRTIQSLQAELENAKARSSYSEKKKHETSIDILNEDRKMLNEKMHQMAHKLIAQAEQLDQLKLALAGEKAAHRETLMKLEQTRQGDEMWDGTFDAMELSDLADTDLGAFLDDLVAKGELSERAINSRYDTPYPNEDTR